MAKKSGVEANLANVIVHCLVDTMGLQAESAETPHFSEHVPINCPVWSNQGPWNQA